MNEKYHAEQFELAVVSSVRMATYLEKSLFRPSLKNSDINLKIIKLTGMKINPSPEHNSIRRGPNLQTVNSSYS